MNKTKSIRVLDTQFHRDGTITYWSVYKRVWVRRASTIENRELAAMGPIEREKVKCHLQKCSTIPRVEMSEYMTDNSVIVNVTYVTTRCF